MKRPRAVVMLSAMVLMGIGLPGCRSSSIAGRARLAEREGRHQEAYQLYCEEARQNPSSGGVRNDIARVAPKAARYWQSEGDRAGARGQYADAWKCYMQALEMTPDNDALVSLVRNFEAQHPDAIASAREEWIAGEGGPLASARPSEPGVEPKQTSPAPSARPDPPAPADGAASELRGEQPVIPAIERPRESMAAADPPVEPRSPPGVVPPAAVRSEPGPAAQDGRDGNAAEAAPQDPRYIYTGILSMTDRRFPKRSPPIDGLRVRLLDTDPEPDADFEVSLDDVKAKKAKNVPAGRGVVVRGRSGRWYEVVVLTVVDSTESVRIGVRPHSR